ncbi:MAG: universal stress protein, partial [Alphaproteobacteria bacterium]
MFSRILVAVDERGHADHAVSVAADLAAKCQAQLLLLTVMADEGLVEDLDPMAQEEGLYVAEVTQRILDQVEQVART